MVAGRRRWHASLTYLALVAISLFCLFPVAWMVVTSLKTLPDTFAIPPTWMPRHATLTNYVDIWTTQSFERYFFNSVFVSGAATLLALVLAALAGYGFSRFRSRTSRYLMTFALVTQMFPSVLLVIPYFLFAGELGLLDTYPALIVAYASFALPLAIWLMKGFMDQIPAQIDEAALVDGCTRLGVFLRIILPLSWPGIAATAIFSFLIAWNEFLFAVVLTSSPQMHVMTVGIASLIGQFRIQWNQLMAGAVLASIPPVALYALVARHMVEGLSAGAVKG